LTHKFAKEGRYASAEEKGEDMGQIIFLFMHFTPGCVMLCLEKKVRAMTPSPFDAGLLHLCLPGRLNELCVLLRPVPQAAAGGDRSSGVRSQHTVVIHP
jgi:hypothetical protein